MPYANKRGLYLLLILWSLWSIPCTSNESKAPTYQLMLYYSPNCPYCKKVTEYLNQIHKTVPMKDILLHPEYREELAQKGGKKQVPCLFIDNTPLYSSDQILAWLKAHQSSLPDEPLNKLN